MQMNGHTIFSRFHWSCFLVTSLMAGLSFGADSGDCAQTLGGLGKSAANPACTASTDLTTANPQTTPADNSIPGLPPGASTPRADALQTPRPPPPGPSPITTPHPRLQ